MKQKYFSKLENKYYYGISRTFWHFFTAIAVVCFVVGVVMIGWSYIPPSKDKVEKAPLPQKETYHSCIFSIGLEPILLQYNYTLVYKSLLVC